MTADHLVNNNGEEEDSDIPVNIVAVVLLDGATRWIAVYPTASKTTEHTIEALQPLVRAGGDLRPPPQDNHRQTVWQKGPSER